LKWAETANGYIDKDRSDQTNGIFWITQPETQVLVHKWRHEEAAILVGKNTVKNDNPSLTCRAYAGNSPTRIIIDPKLRLDYGRFNVGDRTVKTIVLTEKEVISKGNLSFIQPASFEVKDILNCLYMQEIQSVIIEGGKVTLTHFIDSKCWDEARVLKGISNLKSGTLAPQLNNDELTRKMIGKDELSIYLND
jgi:diaminohydroxyphosphoribosylaminopyrimidine deaminase/5-amino-6-(5-phosphoribosylamino)uracil reductase